VALRFSPARYWILLFLTPALMLAPWVIRNQRVLGSPGWTRSNFGLEMALSNTEGSAPTLEQNVLPGGIHSRMHPWFNRAELGKVAAMGEIDYNREKLQKAKVWIAGHPAGFLWLTVRRFAFFWFPVMVRPVQTALNALITLLAFFGLVVWFRQASPVRMLPVLFIATYPLPYYVIETSSRYRFPLEPIMLLFACYSLLDVAARFGLHRQSGTVAAIK
jgi:hypothetical protein